MGSWEGSRGGPVGVRSGELTGVVGIPTSKKTEVEARALGIPLADLEFNPNIDLSIDGTDEVDPFLNLVLSDDIVVVGAGIAGLATALSLHRLGILSLVLEQGESLCTGRTSLTLFKNGWRVLDAVGIADELRSKFLQIQCLVMRSDGGRELRLFSFEEEAPGQEVRAVERRVLLETLASRLPSDSISYLSKLKGLRKHEDGGTLLELDDGSQILAK